MNAIRYVVSYGQLLDIVYDDLREDSFFLDSLTLAVCGRSFYHFCPPQGESKAQAFNRKMDSFSPISLLRVYNTLCFIKFHYMSCLKK